MKTLLINPPVEGVFTLGGTMRLPLGLGVLNAYMRRKDITLIKECV